VDGRTALSPTGARRFCGGLPTRQDDEASLGEANVWHKKHGVVDRLITLGEARHVLLEEGAHPTRPTRAREVFDVSARATRPLRR